MKTEREDRKRIYNQVVNESKSVVADELLFTASIMKWLVPSFFQLLFSIT